MAPGFAAIMAAQFFSALADNALLIAAIAALRSAGSPAEFEPLLKTSFTVSYVVLAAFVGAFADSMPKRKVMWISNGIKALGCLSMFAGLHPLAAYAIVGLGAAAYSPAKYGILTELLPPKDLVAANGWIEGLTVGAIVLGVTLGGLLVNPSAAAWLLAFDFPVLDLGVDEPVEAALCVVGALYLAAAALNAKIPDTGVDHKPLSNSPAYLFREFWHCVSLLWRDRLGRISLAVTTLFWGAGATLQFIVLDWGRGPLGLDLSKASLLQGVVAFGVAFGAVAAARKVSMRGAVKVIPLGIGMGLLVACAIWADSVWAAAPALAAIGALSGFFVVPMNALLQHRGHVLMGAGHSIAVQNFNENLSILALTSLYSAGVKCGLSVEWAGTAFGLFVALAMAAIWKWHRSNPNLQEDLDRLGDGKGHG